MLLSKKLAALKDKLDPRKRNGANILFFVEGAGSGLQTITSGRPIVACKSLLPRKVLVLNLVSSVYICIMGPESHGFWIHTIFPPKTNTKIIRILYFADFLMVFDGF